MSAKYACVHFIILYIYKEMKCVNYCQGRINRILKRRELIVCKYSGCTLLAIVGVLFLPMNCNRNIIPTYGANLHNKTCEKLMFLIASTLMNFSNLKGDFSPQSTPPHPPPWIRPRLYYNSMIIFYTYKYLSSESARVGLARAVPPLIQTSG